MNVAEESKEPQPKELFAKGTLFQWVKSGQVFKQGGRLLLKIERMRIKLPASDCRYRDIPEFKTINAIQLTGSRLGEKSRISADTPVGLYPQATLYTLG